MSDLPEFPGPGSSGLEPAGQAGGSLEPPDSSDVVEQVAAALRADNADLETYTHVLSATIGDLLPPGMVEIERDRSLSDRMAGRPGSPSVIRLRLGDRTLELRSRHGRLLASSAQSVRGVTISSKEISVAEWTEQLATHLTSLAAENAQAREALGRLLGA
jgi:hypothetical protein